MFISHTSELNEHPSKNAGERTYIERVKEAVATAKHVPQQMTQFTAVAEPPSSYDVLRVNECNVYVGIHGVRWGSPVHDQPELSYTEQEYEAATAAGIPRLLFLLDPSSSELNLPEEALQDSQYGDRQEAFRRRLLQESGCIVKFFRSPDHLADLVGRSLKELERLSGYREGGRSDWIWPRAWDFRAYRLQKRQGFVGRQWLFEEVRRWAEDEVSTPGRGQALLITADYGVGKSAFLAELIDTNSAGAKIAAHHFCSTEEDATLSPSVFVRSVAAQLAEALPDYRQLLEADDAKSLRDWLDDADQQQDPQKAFKAFDQSILAPLLSIEAPPQPMLLVVDALDEAQDPRSAGAQAAQATIVQLLARYANRLPPWLKLLATSRRRSDVLKCMQQAFVVKELDAEAGQNLDDLRNYSEERCNSQPLERFIVSAGMTTTEVAGFLSSQEQSRGKFLYVVLVLNDLEFGLLPLASREDLNDLPSGLEEFYRNAFERRFPTEESYALARDILGVLCEAREPIGRRELAAILQCSEHEIGASIRPLHDLLRLQVKATERNGVRTKEVVHSFDHASLAQWLSEEDEWLMQRAGRFAVDREEALQKIRAWGITEFEAKRAHSWDYLVRHLIEHLSVTTRGLVQSVLLASFDWLEARMRLAGINSLLGDFQHIHSIGYAIKIRDAIRQSRQALLLSSAGEASIVFASQMLSRLVSSDCEPEIKTLREHAALVIRRDSNLLPLTSSLANTPKLLETIPVNELRSIAESETGKIIIGTRFGDICLWDIRLGQAVASTKCDGRSTGLVASLGYSCIAVAVDHCIQIWDLTLRKCECKLVGHSSDVTSLLHIGKERLASSAKDGTVRIWDTRTQENTLTIQNNSLHVRVLGPASTDEILIADINKIYVCNYVHSTFQTCFCAEGALVKHASMVDEGKFLCHIDTEVKLWDATNSLWSSCIFTNVEVLRRIDNVVYAVLLLDGSISFWDYSTGVSSHYVDAGAGAYDLLALGGNLMATCHVLSSLEFSIRIYDTSQQGTEAVREACHGILSLTKFRGKILAGSLDETIRAYNPETREIESAFPGHWRDVALLAALRGQLWEEETSAVKFLRHASWEGACLRLRNGQVLYQFAEDDYPQVRSLQSGECRILALGVDETMTSLSETTDGVVVLGTSHGTLYTWNNSEGVTPVPLPGHSRKINSIATINGDTFATGSSDRTIRLWKLGVAHQDSKLAFVADSAIMAITFYEPLQLLIAGDASGRLHWLQIPESLRS